MARLIASALLSATLIACTPGDGREPAVADGSGMTPAARGDELTASPDAPVSNLDPIAPQPPPKPTADCPVLGSQGWSAAVITEPPGAGDRLRVHGSLRLAEGGWRARLERGAVLEIHPPIQQLEVKFERTGASGPREIAVRGEFPALNDYGAIDIRCGNRSLASITSVAWTENQIMENKVKDEKR